MIQHLPLWCGIEASFHETGGKSVDTEQIGADVIVHLAVSIVHTVPVTKT